jgi:hypothetical protein
MAFAAFFNDRDPAS